MDEMVSCEMVDDEMVSCEMVDDEMVSCETDDGWDGKLWDTNEMMDEMTW